MFSNLGTCWCRFFCLSDHVNILAILSVFSDFCAFLLLGLSGFQIRINILMRICNPLVCSLHNSFHLSCGKSAYHSRIQYRRTWHAVCELLHGFRQILRALQHLASFSLPMIIDLHCSVSWELYSLQRFLEQFQPLYHLLFSFVFGAGFSHHMRLGMKISGNENEHGWQLRKRKLQHDYLHLPYRIW